MPPRILFLTLLDDVGSDRIVAAMGRSGCACAVMGRRDGFAARSRYAAARFPLPRLGGQWTRTFRLAARLGQAVREWRPDLVIPLDDLSARTLRAARFRRAVAPEVERLLERSFGAPSGFAAICSRDGQIALAAAHGVRTPQQRPIETLEEARRVAAEFGYPLVLKREQTCGGFGVTIVKAEAELAPAFRAIRSKASLKRAMQSLLRLATADQSALVLQAHVSGPMAFRVVACAEGRVLDGISFVADQVHPPVTGASTVLRPVDRPDMDAATRAMVGALGCSGLISLDFILGAEGACLIEVNARPVASGHLGALYGHDIYKALVDNACGLPVASAGRLSTGPQRIALFPRELDRDPSAASLAAGTPMPLHDLPSDDPGLVAVYAGWLERRHPTEGAALRRLLLGPIAAPAERRRSPRRPSPSTAALAR